MRKLKKIYIEITNVCNLSCAFCPGTERKPTFINASDFEIILKKLKGYTEFLYYHVMGEPLLHPQIAALLELCDGYGYKVNITTNGIKIKEQADYLINSTALRQVNFSLHSREEIDDRTKIDEYLEDIFSFSQRALTRGDIYVSYRLWNITSENSSKYNSYVCERIEEYWRPGFSVLDELGSQIRLKLRERLYINSASVFNWPSLSAPYVGDRGFCLGLRDQAAILADGTVVPCCLDGGGNIRLGNIFEEDFGKILTCERSKAVYEGFSERRAVEQLCKKCGYRTRFSKDEI